MLYIEYNVVFEIQRKGKAVSMNHFGSFLKKERVESKITLRKFADMLGMDAANYSRMERGLALPPDSEDRLKAMAKYLGFEQSSEKYKEMVRLASICRGQIPPAILSDEAVLSKLPVLFRTLEGKKIDTNVMDDLYEAMKKE